MSRKNVTFILDPRKHGHERHYEEGQNGIPNSNQNVGMPALPRPLTLEEKRYLLAVERGDLTTVRKMLGRAESVGMDPNCVDALGRGALALAIDAENLSMVQLLVVLGVRTGDALLHAVDAGFVEAAQLLLEHEELVHKLNQPYSWECVDRTTSRYTPDMTPLVLAAHRDNYEILKMLLDRGATLPMPHDLRCGCSTCVSEEEADSLRRSVTRLNEYRALASPSLLALSSGDPLLAAFQLSWELRGLATAEPECRTEYLELRRQCQQFAVDLLRQARSSAELAVILNHDPDNPPYEDGDVMTLARLQLAILYKQKKFVAHPYVQQLLSSLWYAGLPGFRRQPALQRALAVIRVVAGTPLLCISYAIAPSCGPARLLKQPFVKFLVHASCYMFFLLMLILVSQRAEIQFGLLFSDEKGKEEILRQEKFQRGNPPSPLEWIVLIYVIGFIWEETSEMFHLGLHRYLRNLWNFIDFLRNSLYVLGAMVRAVAYFQQQKEIELDSSAALIPRENWANFDPQLVADGLLAAANIFSALKLVHLFSINPHLGPLQISLGRMVNDIVKFLFIYSLVLFSFACGLNQLLWYFADLERQKCYHLPGGLPDWENNGDSCTKWRSFSSLFEASQSLFWASFGDVGIENFQLEGIKSYTRFWGLLMFGSYSVINVIVLLNLLIAMMSTSYAMIEERADTEWKFARTKLWLSYFQDSSTLPPPFNILPTPKRILRLLQCGRSTTKRISITKPTGVNPKAGDERTSPDVEGHIFRRYDAMMRALVWRYVSTSQRLHELAPATEDAVGELRSDLSSLRCRLLDVFAKNGMDVSAETEEPGGEPPSGKRLRGWERRLLKDFAVTPQPAGAAGAQLLMGPPPPGEKPLEKFKRVARLVLLRSSTQRWRRAIHGICYQSQIGRSHPGRGRESLTKLQRAMAEAQRLAVQVEQSVRCPSPVAPLAAAIAPASAAAANNVLQLLRATSQPENLNVPSESESTLSAQQPIQYTLSIDEPPVQKKGLNASPTGADDEEQPDNIDAQEDTMIDTQGDTMIKGGTVIDTRQDSEIDTREDSVINTQEDSVIDTREDTIIDIQDESPSENRIDTETRDYVNKGSLQDYRGKIDDVKDINQDETERDTTKDTRDEIRIDITEEDDDELEELEKLQPEKMSTVAGLIGIFKQKTDPALKETPTKARAPPPPKLQIPVSLSRPFHSPSYAAVSPQRSPHPSPIRSPSPRTGWF